MLVKPGVWKILDPSHDTTAGSPKCDIEDQLPHIRNIQHYFALAHKYVL